MKNNKLLLAFAVLGLGFFSACGNNKSNNSGQENDTKEITYWQHSSVARDDLIKAIAKDFEDKNPGVKIKLEFIPEADYSQKLITSLASDSAPDVFQVQSGMIYKLAKAKSIQPLDSSVLSNESIESDFIEATVKPLNYDGDYYGLPTDTQTILSFWNKKLVSDIGKDTENAPTSWEDFFEYAKAMTKNKNGKMVQAGWGTVGYDREVEAYVLQNGGKLFDDEKQKFVFADDDNAMKAIKKMASLYRDDKVYSTDLGATWQGFRQGLVGEMLGHPAMMGNLPQTAPDLDFGVGLIPAENGEHLTTLTSWAYTSSKNAPTKLASQFIEYLSSEEVQKKWTQKTGELPAHKSLLEDKDLIADPETAIALESLKNSVSSNLQTGALNKIWTTQYERILLSDESVETIMKECQDELNNELEKDL
ncbi:ABC transporter substrate-binding protein [Enterococcus massiliensis]|uniref:ABC transporter substrate-binding protein n=1 Tax=Enterococcus massiliensis TaxID=1640685 RepID=UPI00065DC401|nr:ABC transporter substrate-binding protein [Enterococcus massiliensis]